MAETWLPVVGYEGLYEVSNEGRVRSLDRLVFSPNPDRHVMHRGRILKPGTLPTGHLSVGLYREGIRKQIQVHRLVIGAFVGPLPEEMQTRHLNGRAADNRIENLTYGTRSENQLDRIRHGTHNHAGKPRCKWGHAFDARNTYIRPSTGARVCRACKRQRVSR